MLKVQVEKLFSGLMRVYHDQYYLLVNLMLVNVAFLNELLNVLDISTIVDGF